MNDLIINGIDHSVFDLEWAKRGGVFVIKPKYMEINDETMRDYEFFYTFCAGKVICINDYDVMGLDDGSTYVGIIDSIKNDGYLEVRMATPQECEDAGIEYIEPLYAELEELRKDRERLDWLLDVRAAHLVTGVVQCLGPYREPAQTPREAIDNAMKVGE